MFHYSLAVSLLALILGDEVSSRTEVLPTPLPLTGLTTQPSQDDDKVPCFLGFPTFSCRWNCILSGGTSSCDEDQTCQCLVDDDEGSEETSGQDGLKPALKANSPSLVGDPTPSERPYSEQCFFGFPSFSCRFRCYMKNQQGFCGSDDVCECRETDDEVKDSQESLGENEEVDDSLSPQYFTSSSSGIGAAKSHLGCHEDMILTSRDSSEDYETEDSTPTIFLFFFNLSNLFGSNNETDNNDTSATTGPEMQPEDSSLMSADTRLLLENTVALIIILLLTVLIVMEVYACYNKNKGKGHIQTLFKTPN